MESTWRLFVDEEESIVFSTKDELDFYLKNLDGIHNVSVVEELRLLLGGNRK